jgi:DNA-binding NtrC family response regulator
MKQEFKILFVEDTTSDVELMKREIRKSNIEFTSLQVYSKKGFSEALISFSPDIILCDHSLPQFDSVSALKMAKKINPQIPFLVVTGFWSDEYALECLNYGAYDYILKTDLTRLPFAVKNALSKSALIQKKSQ